MQRQWHGHCTLCCHIPDRRGPAGRPGDDVPCQVSIEGAPLSMQISHATCDVTWWIRWSLVSANAFSPIRDVFRPAAMNSTLLQRPIAPSLAGLRQGAGDALPFMHPAVQTARYRIVAKPISRASAAGSICRYMLSAAGRCRRPVVM